VEDPSLSLYPPEQRRAGLEGAVRRMRRDLTVRLESAHARTSGGEILISFSHPDPNKAQAVVRELISRFGRQHDLTVRERWRRAGQGHNIPAVLDRKLGENLVVLGSPTLRADSVSANRQALAVCGIGLGLLLGTIVLWFRRHRGAAPATL
jgi:hypothetical protein